ncbi:MAG: hypothetical protein AAF772_07700, partial [Acidobacteriota bacterium]
MFPVSIARSSAAGSTTVALSGDAEARPSPTDGDGANALHPSSTAVAVTHIPWGTWIESGTAALLRADLASVHALQLHLRPDALAEVRRRQARVVHDLATRFGGTW